MPTLSKKASLSILAIAAIALSRILFALFDDPEGPNLLIVVVTAAVIFSLSLFAYLAKLSYRKRLVFAILVQIALIVGLYLFLN